MSNVDVLHIRPITFPTEHLNGEVQCHPDNDILRTTMVASNLTAPITEKPFSAAAHLATWDGVDSPLKLFKDIPPLHTGPVPYHLQAGIERAMVAASANEEDAERAFFVADLSYVYKQFLRWTTLLPSVKPFYAVKCNPDPYVLRLLAALGAGFDCASHGEITQVLSLGTVAPSRIIYANPCKALSFIRHARKVGVDTMTFDNVDELLKVSRTYPEAQLVLRILTDDSKSVCRLGLKFGAPIQTVSHLLAKAKELDLNVVGVSFHVGSGCYDPGAFAEAVCLARRAFDMGKQAGYSFSLLDVGGGFEDETFESTAAVLRSAISRNFGDLIEGGVRVIAEPGRFFVSKAFSLAANIIARRGGSQEDMTDHLSPVEPVAEEKEEGEKTPQVMYYINDGVYGAFNCILFDHQEVDPYVLTLERRAVEAARPGEGIVVDSRVESPLRELQACSVWGPTCDSIDCVRSLTFLPRRLQVGDWLGFASMGAYTICAASQFNGFERSGVVYTAGVGGASRRVQELLRETSEEIEAICV